MGLQEAMERVNAVRMAAMVLPAGTEISLPAGSVEDVRAIAEVLGMKPTIFWYPTGFAGTGAPYVIEVIHIPVEKVRLRIAATRPAVEGDREAAGCHVGGAP